MEKLNKFNAYHTSAVTPTVFEIIRQTLVERYVMRALPDLLWATVGENCQHLITINISAFSDEKTLVMYERSKVMERTSKIEANEMIIQFHSLQCCIIYALA